MYQHFFMQGVSNHNQSSALLSENGFLFTTTFFQNVSRIWDVKNWLTTTYHPQTNDRVELFHRTVFNALWTFVEDHSTNWDLYTYIKTYTYNTQLHWVTVLTTFELVLLLCSSPVAIEPQHVLDKDPSPKHHRQTRKSSLKTIVLEV